MGGTWGQRLRHGALAGIAGGLVSSVVLWVLVAPAIDTAISLEASEAPGHSHDDAVQHSHDAGETVTRLQQQVGGIVTVVIVAALMALAFTVVYARARHRLPGSSDLGKSLALAGLTFVALVAFPAILVPANPPGVGDPGTVSERTGTYLLAILFGVLAILATFSVQAALTAKGVASETRWLATAVAGSIAVTLALALAPTAVSTIPAAMPAATIWQFRIGSLLQQGAMWITIGIAFGYLRQRAVVATRSHDLALRF